MDYTVAMQRAIALSEKGLGKCAPNPIVGAVILDASGERSGPRTGTMLNTVAIDAVKINEAHYLYSL